MEELPESDKDSPLEDSKKHKRDLFWKSTPQEYAEAQTKNLDENTNVLAYPAAYLFRSLFTANFWMFTLIGIIIFITFKSAIMNDIS